MQKEIKDFVNAIIENALPSSLVQTMAKNGTLGKTSSAITNNKHTTTTDTASSGSIDHAKGKKVLNPFNKADWKNRQSAIDKAIDG